MYVEFVADLLNVDGVVFVGKGWVLGDDEERFEVWEGCDDVFDDVVGEIFLFWFFVDVYEG